MGDLHLPPLLVGLHPFLSGHTQNRLRRRACQLLTEGLWEGCAGVLHVQKRALWGLDEFVSQDSCGESLVPSVTTLTDAALGEENC